METIRHPSTTPPFDGDPKSQQVKTRRVVLASQLLNIEPPKGLSQLTGYYLAASYGLYESTFSADQIEQVSWLHRTSVPNYVARPSEDQTLIPWSDADRQRLGLMNKPKSAPVPDITPPSAADVPDEYKIQVVHRPVDPACRTAKRPNFELGPHRQGTDPMDIPRIQIDRKKS